MLKLSYLLRIKTGSVLLSMHTYHEEPNKVKEMHKGHSDFFKQKDWHENKHNADYQKHTSFYEGEDQANRKRHEDDNSKLYADMFGSNEEIGSFASDYDDTNKFLTKDEAKTLIGKLKSINDFSEFEGMHDATEKDYEKARNQLVNNLHKVIADKKVKSISFEWH